MRPVAASVAVVALVAGCAARQPLPPAPPEPTREGLTSVRVLEAPPGAEPPEVVIETLTPAYASNDNQLPEYPDYALEAGCQTGVVPMRVYISDEGNVADVRAVPGRPVTDDQCHSAFWAATCLAVQAWKFAPAFRQRSRPGPDRDGDGNPDFTRWEQTPVTIYLDFEFTFRVVEGKGEVASR